MNKNSILNRFWEKKYGQCPLDDYEDVDSEMEYSDEEEGLDSVHDDLSEEIDAAPQAIEEASEMLEEFVESHEDIESAALSLMLKGAWSGKDVALEDMADGQGKAYATDVVGSDGQSHRISSAMWDNPKQERQEYE